MAQMGAGATWPICVRCLTCGFFCLFSGGLHVNQSGREKVSRIQVDGTNYTASAGSSAVTSDAIDMAGFEGVKLYIGFGAIVSGAVTSVKVQQSSDDGSSDAYSDLEDSSVTVADDDDNKVVVIDIFRPRKRYLKVVTSRATQNATVDFLVAVQYGARKEPTSDDSTTVISREIHRSPAEGTA